MVYYLQNFTYFEKNIKVDSTYEIYNKNYFS